MPSERVNSFFYRLVTFVNHSFVHLRHSIEKQLNFGILFDLNRKLLFKTNNSLPNVKEERIHKKVMNNQRLAIILWFEAHVDFWSSLRIEHTNY